MTPEQLIKGLQGGSLAPEDALAEYEKGPFRAFSDVKLSDLYVDTLDSGFPSLDEHDIFKQGKGELIVVCARPGQGKSAFAFQVAMHVARKLPVLLFTLEMNLESIKQRMLAAETGRSLKHIKTRGLVPEHLLAPANARLDELKIIVFDQNHLDIESMLGLSKKAAGDEPLGLIVVDYLQIISAEGRTRAEEVGHVAQMLKRLAQDMKCPVLAAAQVNRQCEIRGKETGDYTPGLADLADSAKIEHFSDAIIALSREELYNGKRPQEADVAIIKNRSGQTVRMNFKWLGASTKFIDPLSVPEGKPSVTRIEW